MPFTRGSSGPTIVKSIWLSLAKFASLSILSAGILILIIPFSFSVPPLPGAT